MTHLIAVAGHTGSGKSTAVEYLKTLCGGESVYLGAAVLEYMRTAQIPITPENELHWRLKLREQDGPAAFAKIKSAAIISSLASGVPVLVDAIFAPDEFKLLKSEVGRYPAYLIAITASFETRCNRLRTRPKRPLSVQEVAERDRKELEQLGTAEVLAAATFSIENDGLLDEFHATLSKWWASISKS